MTVTVGSTGITFNDSTVQSTAAVTSSYAGHRAQVFTASGTFTVPAGVTAVKVTLCGGGGGGSGMSNYAVSTGGTGGTSSFGAYCSATGGAGGKSSGGIAAGGTGSGLIVFPGNSTSGGVPGASCGTVYGTVYGVLGGSRGGVNTASPYSFPGTGYGNGGSGVNDTSGTYPGYGGGGAGVVMAHYVSGLTPGSTVAVTVGGGGAGATGGFTGGAGSTGIVIVEW